MRLLLVSLICTAVAIILLALLAGGDDDSRIRTERMADSLRAEIETDTLKSRVNMTVVIQQSAINDLLLSIGDLSGEHEVLFGSKLKWNITNQRVRISDSGAVFVADVSVAGFGQSQQTKGIGLAHVEYNYDKGRFDLILEQIQVDLRAKIPLLGIPLGQLDFANFFDTRIALFKVPLEAGFSVKKQQEKQPVYFAVMRHEVRYSEKLVTVDLSVDFREALKDEPMKARVKESESAF